MTNKQLKNLKDTLWTTADQLRANSGLKSTEYAEPILGLIFLRFADVKYSKFEPEIKAEFDSIKGTRMERPIHEIAIEKCGFYLPEEARYDWLLNLPESEDLAKKVKEAMEAVEKYTAELEDTLPKDIYYSVNSEDDPLVLAKLLKNFKDIPADVELDIFGEIYEYFLGEFHWRKVRAAVNSSPLHLLSVTWLKSLRLLRVGFSTQLAVVVVCLFRPPIILKSTMLRANR